MFGLFRRGKIDERSIKEQLEEIKRLSVEHLNLLEEEIKTLKKMSTKRDIEGVINEIREAKDVIVEELYKRPDSEEISHLLVEHITQPVKEYISKLVGGKEEASNRLNTYQALEQIKEPIEVLDEDKKKESLDEVVSEMKAKLSMLSQRHIRILNILAQNRDMWMTYNEISAHTSPPLTPSCIRGYISDLVNNYKIPIDKKMHGKITKVRLPSRVFKQLAITRLNESLDE